MPSEAAYKRVKADRDDWMTRAKASESLLLQALEAMEWHREMAALSITDANAELNETAQRIRQQLGGKP